MNTFGQHAVTLGNMNDPQVDALMNGEKAHVLYCDPPWGDGYLKMFATHTEKATGKRPLQINHEQLCKRLAQLVERYVTGYVFIETSHKCAAEVADHLRGVTSNLRIQDASYASNLSLALISANVGGRGLPKLDVGSLKGVAFVKKLLAYVVEPNAIVLDPCCGAGYTARATAYHGMRFRGNELNPARLAKTKTFLESF